MKLLPGNPWIALPIAWLGFVSVSLVVKAALAQFPSGPRWREQAVLKGAVFVLALAAATLEGLGLCQLGFCRPEHAVWGRAILGGVALGALATGVMLIMRANGMRSIIGGYSFGAILLWIWIGSSVAEEVFCRGWFQTSTGVDTLLPSAILFGSLHLTLFFAGVDLRSAAIVVIATTVLGLVAAWARAASASLYPAIAAHVAFNLGGAVAGVFYVAVTGKLPSQSTPGTDERSSPPT